MAILLSEVREQKNVHTVYVKQDWVGVCVCVCVWSQKRRQSSTPQVPYVRCVYVSLYGHTLRGHFSIGTIGPRESVLCSQRSSDVVRVQSLWECLKYRDKGKNKRSPRRVWSKTTVCVGGWVV